MRILLAVDGSEHTQKAIHFLLAYKGFTDTDNTLCVVNVQAPVPNPVQRMLRSAQVAAYHREESDKALEPVQKYLESCGLPCQYVAVVGNPKEDILAAAKKEQSDMIVMGTHGHGLIGRALMGSVAQRVVTDSEIPVLLVKQRLSAW